MTDKQVVRRFEQIAGAGNAMAEEADRQAYAYDSAVLDSVVPAMVVRPETMEQPGQVVALCNENGLPLTVRGSGTNLSDGTIPSSTRSVVVVTNALARIIEINREDMYAVVEPGVITARFAAAAEDFRHAGLPVNAEALLLIEDDRRIAHGRYR
ncbi:MAG: FAD-binding oxidoreductase [Desulfosalsimonas sp.]